MQQYKMTSPWLWVPSAYFMEGLPFTMVVVVSAIMYKNFGLSNATITYYTGWLMLPWTIKPLWSWFIDLYKTKRWWIYTMEFMFSVALVLVTLSLQTPFYFTLSLFAFACCTLTSSSHDIATDGFYLISLTSGQQSFFVGMQSAFYQVAKIFGSGLLVILSGILLEHTKHNVSLSWGIVISIAASIAFIIAAYHRIVLPRNELIQTKTFKQVIPEIKQVFISLFQLKQIWVTILFALTFRLGETMLAKIVPLFILDSRDHGGLGFNNAYIGVSNVCNLIAIISAGILGGVCISRLGLKRCLWPMLLLVNVPHLVFVYLAYTQPTSEIIVLILQIIEHFAANMSLTGYMMVTFYLVKDSQYKTSHYAFIAAIMMVTNMIPSMLSGVIQEYLGYLHYFIFILGALLPSMVVISMLKIDSEFGLKI